MTTVGPRPPRPRDASATRADLLRAARRRFTLFGFEHTTSRDIAADAGANVSLINRYFGSKEGLLEAVLRETTITPDDLVASSGAELVRSMLDSLAPGAWPEYGYQHPLLLLLRGLSSDSMSNELRRRGLEDALRYFTTALADPDQGTATAALDEPNDAPGAASRPAGLLFALMIGIITLRELLPDHPFGDASSLDLAGELARLSQRIADPA